MRAEVWRRCSKHLRKCDVLNERRVDLMAIIARGRIADTTSRGTFMFSAQHDYILADEQGHEILYLLQGDSDYIGVHHTDKGNVG